MTSYSKAASPTNATSLDEERKFYKLCQRMREYVPVSTDGHYDEDRGEIRELMCEAADFIETLDAARCDQNQCRRDQGRANRRDVCTRQGMRLMRFTKGNVVVEILNDETRLMIESVGDDLPRILGAGMALPHDEADDMLAALWVSHLARQKVDDETLRIGAEVQGVVIEK